MNSSSKRVIDAADEIEKIMDASVPTADTNLLRRVQFLCIQMRCLDNYINEKASKISGLASNYFSARKHQKYPGGAAQLKSEITFGLLGRIRRQVEYLDKQTEQS